MLGRFGSMSRPPYIRDAFATGTRCQGMRRLAGATRGRIAGADHLAPRSAWSGV